MSWLHGIEFPFENRRVIEWYLTSYISGTWEPPRPALPGPRFDLLAAIRRNTLTDRLPPVEAPEEFVPCCILNDLQREASDGTAGTSPPDRKGIQVTVSSKPARSRNCHTAVPDG